MTPTDLRLICTALGFTAVVLQGDKIPKKEAALRATGFANLIEEFCRVSVPEAFTENEDDIGNADLAGSNTDKKFEMVNRMATAIVEIMKEKGGCLPQDLFAKGFAPEEVERHWAMAKALAHVELKIMDA